MELCIIRKGQQLFLIAQINNQYIYIIIDSGATSNFINKQQANSYDFSFRKKMKPYVLYILDGGAIRSNEGQVTFETKVLTMKMLKGHIEDIQFNITIIGTHTIVLGAPWLQLYNPQID